MRATWNVVITGVGGQGVVSTARVLAEAAMDAGFRVKGVEIVGGAQRGGTVLAHVRFGHVVHSPIVPDGQADIIIGMEPLEALRASIQFVRDDSLVIFDESPVHPLPVQLGQQRYPLKEDILLSLRKLTNKVFTIEAYRLASSIGAKVTASTILLGYATAISKIPIQKEFFIETIKRTFTDDMLKFNIKAFELGFSWVSKDVEKTGDNRKT